MKPENLKKIRNIFDDQKIGRKFYATVPQANSLCYKRGVGLETLLILKLSKL